MVKVFGELWSIWVFPKIGIPQNGWFIMENLIKMDDLGGKPPIFGNTHMFQRVLLGKLLDQTMSRMMFFFLKKVSQLKGFFFGYQCRKLQECTSSSP